jgi:predicted HAD superfamily Cof-like phosphohydrolase
MTNEKLPARFWSYKYAIKNSVQRDVEEFHRVVLGIKNKEDTPAIRRPELRAELIREEARETVEAIERGDLIEAIDGMCDLLCVIYGTAAEFGINLAPFWNEVHRSNMAKIGGPIREDGKQLKPANWQPPDIKGVLDLFTSETDDAQTEFNPLGGAARGVGRCVCAAGPGTNPACEIHP